MRNAVLLRHAGVAAAQIPVDCRVLGNGRGESEVRSGNLE